MSSNRNLPAPSGDRLIELSAPPASPAAPFRYALARPLTLVPLAVGVGGLAGLMIFDHVFLAVALSVVGFLGGGLSLFAHALARKAQLTAEGTSAGGPSAASLADRLPELKQALFRSQYEPATAGPAEQALSQYQQATDKLKVFQKALGEKFSPAEITYGRYFTASEQVFLAVMEHLQEVAGILASLAPVDRERARERLATLRQEQAVPASSGQAAAVPPDPAVQGEIRTLEERLRLHDQHLDRIQALLAYNERALTELDRVSLAISSIRTQRGGAAVDLDVAIKELEALAARAKKYSV
jgi:hypothetical protein